jgi:putative acetyltransferase
MEFARAGRPEAKEIAGFFAAIFTAADGVEEGRLVSGLARDLMLTVPEADIAVLTCREGAALAGCIILTRLHFPEDTRTVFLLSPVGVATARQGQGIGQALLRCGIALMQEAGVEVVMTYGDPEFYGRVGFRQVTVAEVAAPRALRQPAGWLALGLGGGAVTLKGPARCVSALDKADYW